MGRRLAARNRSPSNHTLRAGRRGPEPVVSVGICVLPERRIEREMHARDQEMEPDNGHDDKFSSSPSQPPLPNFSLRQQQATGRSLRHRRSLKSQSWLKRSRIQVSEIVQSQCIRRTARKFFWRILSTTGTLCSALPVIHSLVDSDVSWVCVS